MKNLNTNWSTFAKSGAIQDYISYKSNLSGNVIQNQGESKNAHKDGRSGNQRTEYR
ncbi:MAG: hypothetical protein RR069_05800 [Oscillospiraceae bacterium]